MPVEKASTRDLEGMEEGSASDIDLVNICWRKIPILTDIYAT